MFLIKTLLLLEAETCGNTLMEDAETIGNRERIPESRISQNWCFILRVLQV